MQWSSILKEEKYHGEATDPLRHAISNPDNPQQRVSMKVVVTASPERVRFVRGGLRAKGAALEHLDGPTGNAVGDSRYLRTFHQRDAVDMEGGAFSGALPHFTLGREPISNMSVPPLTRTACVNHGLSSVCPFNVAD